MARRKNLTWLALALMTAASAAAQTSDATSFSLIPPYGVGPGQFAVGNGDAATFSTVDNEIDSWFGLGIKGLCCSSYSGYGIVFDARAGSIYTQGSIGIGTASPGVPLDVATGNITSTSLQYTALRVAPASSQGAIGGNGVAIALSSATNAGIHPVATISSQLWDGGNGSPTVYSGALLLSTKSDSNGAPVGRVLIDPNGNVGIGTVTPGSSLEVAGSVTLTQGSGAKMTFQDGSVQSVAWNGVLSGGDYAESVDVIGDRKGYEPGDVLVIDPNVEGKFLKSSQPYSTSVLGVYSTKPGVVGRRQTSDRSHMIEEVPMAMVGVIPTKVCAEGGAIKPGDLLVTSSIPGYAMKGTDRTQMFGAIIGKALGHLDAGTGVMEVGVSIQ